jgi:release factor glutamine methyltransferase
VTVATALAAGTLRLRSDESAEQVRSSARADAQILLGEVLGADTAWMLAHGAEELDDDLLDVFGLLLGERMRGVPIAYLTHKAGFYGREFYVDESVLVPRPETERVVEAALEDLRARRRDGQGLRVLDVGTGSGALAITLAAELPRLRVTATDLSGAALEVARRNARSLGVGDRVRFLEGDLAEAVATERFDCVVANLPYVPSRDVPVPPDPAGFEPVLALDGGADGLDAYRRLLRSLDDAAQPDASLFLEAAPPTAGGLARLVAEARPGARIEIGKDYAGLERFVSVKPC